MLKNRDSDLLEKARNLVASLERGDSASAEAIIGELTGEQESGLFLEIGRLTRELHEAINGFLLDENIMGLAKKEIPDARERLGYVIEMTEKAAHTTLSAVEASLPFVGELEQGAVDLAAGWEDFRAQRLSREEHENLSDRMTAFLSSATRGAKDLHDGLSQVLLAQEYQDLTGQIIRKVIKLVRDLEERLVVLVSVSGISGQIIVSGEDNECSLAGPVVPGVDRSDSVKGQDDVDELLSSLGF